MAVISWLPIRRRPCSNEALAAQTRGYSPNYETDPHYYSASVRFLWRSVFSLGQTAGSGSHAGAKFAVRCGASPRGHGESGGSKKKHAARVSHAQPAAVVAPLDKKQSFLDRGLRGLHGWDERERKFSEPARRIL